MGCREAVLSLISGWSDVLSSGLDGESEAVISLIRGWSDVRWRESGAVSSLISDWSEVSSSRLDGERVRPEENVHRVPCWLLWGMPIVIMPSVEGLELCSRRDEALSSEQLQVELPWAAFHRTQLEWWKDVPSLFVFPYFLSLSLPPSLSLSPSLAGSCCPQCGVVARKLVDIWVDRQQKDKDDDVN